MYISYPQSIFLTWRHTDGRISERNGREQAPCHVEAGRPQDFEMTRYKRIGEKVILANLLEVTGHLVPPTVLRESSVVLHRNGMARAGHRRPTPRALAELKFCYRAP